MKIEVSKDSVETGAGIAARIANKNLSLPVLSCALIVAGKGRAVLRATNLDVSVELPLKAKVLEDGVVAVPSGIFAQTISALTDQKITLKSSGTTLLVESGHGKTSIAAVDSSEFPTLPYVKESATSTDIPTGNLTGALKSVLFSASLSSVKPELASVSLTYEKGELVAAATDSFRLAEIKVPLKAKGSFRGVLIPARNVGDIIRVLEGSEETTMRVGENQCTFLTGEGFITSRTIDGAFPDYRAIIPKESVASAVCLKEDALRAFKKTSIFTDSFNQVHLSLKPSKKLFTVEAANAAVGETNDEIPATLSGDDIEINFNGRYIMDALTVVAGDSVTFSVAGPGRPMVMTDSAARGFTYLVMPMNK